MIKEAIGLVSGKKNLSASQMQSAMEEIMSGQADTADIISLLKALSSKGETVEELSGAVSVMRKHVTRIRADKKIVLDTCGTGGDKKGTFNISTIVAFVASGAGVAVAKHGNRSVSSRCGSADLLEGLGIDINMDARRLQACLNQAGIAFLFAPGLHPAMKYASPARKAIGARTMFNILGPLTNPAGATHQLVGVYDKRWTDILARVLLGLGTVHALVVHGEDGLDEITTTAGTYISEAHNGKVSGYRISPEDFGLKYAGTEDLAGGDVKENIEILFDVLKGDSGPKRDIVLLNAGAAMYAADSAGSIKEGIKLAEDSIDSGKALKKLELLKEYSRNG